MTFTADEMKPLLQVNVGQNTLAQERGWRNNNKNTQSLQTNHNRVILHARVLGANPPAGKFSACMRAGRTRRRRVRFNPSEPLGGWRGCYFGLLISACVLFWDPPKEDDETLRKSLVAAGGEVDLELEETAVGVERTPHDIMLKQQLLLSRR